jgi:hypothetical protein
LLWWKSNKFIDMPLKEYLECQDIEAYIRERLKVRALERTKTTIGDHRLATSGPSLYRDVCDGSEE